MLKEHFVVPTCTDNNVDSQTITKITKKIHHWPSDDDSFIFHYTAKLYHRDKNVTMPLNFRDLNGFASAM